MISSRTRNIFLNILTYIIVISLLFPIIWLLITSLKTRMDAFSMPPKWIFTPTLENFRNVLNNSGFIGSYINSLIIVIGTTFFSLVLGILGGYSISRTKMKFTRFASVWIILSRMAPPIGFALPLFIMFRYLNLLDTYISIIITYLTITLPFVTWLMVGFFDNIPKEIEEAARVDGCNRLQSLIKVLIPSVLPGIATCAIFSFIMAWNEFFYALILSGRNTKTATIEIQGYVSSSGLDWGTMSAAAILIILPVLLFTMFAQRGLIQGLTQGASK